MKNFLNNKIIYNDLKNISSKNILWNRLYNKTIFITGAYGMLASYLVFQLIYLNEIKNANITIVVAIRNKEKLKKRFGIYAEKPYFKIYNLDINNPITYKENVDYIIHAAGIANPNYYSEIPVDVLKPNVIGTYNLLEFAKEKKVKSFLFFSTGDIYGFVESLDKIKEVDYGIVNPLDIHSCYNEGKRIGETMCNAWNKQFNVPIKIARIAHTYGPTMDLDSDPRVFSSFAKNIINDENIEMKSDGSAKRAFCYISDATIAFFMILLHEIDNDDLEVYNVVNSEEFISILELANILVNLFPEKNLKVIKLERDINDSYLENKINNIVLDNSKLRNIGFSPEISVKEGFKRVILFFESLK